MKWWANMVICDGCWEKHMPGRVATRIVGAPTVDCGRCDEPTASGIYVRVRVEWRVETDPPEPEAA